MTAPIGPKIKSVTIAVIKVVIIGTKKNFTAFGEILIAKRSTSLINQTAKITGITVDE